MKRLDIESELLELGAPAGRQGYIQMVTALEFIMQHDDVMCATANLYPYVAERLNTVPPRVERNIREEIYAIWSRGNQDRLNELFVNREKCPPGSKEFLYTLAHRLRHEKVKQQACFFPFGPFFKTRALLLAFFLRCFNIFQYPLRRSLHHGTHVFFVLQQRFVIGIGQEPTFKYY